MSSEDKQEDLYHYLSDGGNLTVCGLEAHRIMMGAPLDRSVCEICQGSEKADFSTSLGEIDD